MKKWGLAPMTGSLAPPPPYGSEQGSILLEAGRDGTLNASHYRSRSGVVRSGPPASPGPTRSPTDISLAQLEHVPSHPDVGEGTSRVVSESPAVGLGISDPNAPPPDYSSPDLSSTDSMHEDSGQAEHAPLLASTSPRPPIPSYDSAVGSLASINSADRRH